MSTNELKVGDRVLVIKDYDETRQKKMVDGFVVSVRVPARPLVQFPGCEGHDGNAIDWDAIKEWRRTHPSSGKDFYYVNSTCLKVVRAKKVVL